MYLFIWRKFMLSVIFLELNKKLFLLPHEFFFWNEENIMEELCHFSDAWSKLSLIFRWKQVIKTSFIFSDICESIDTLNLYWLYTISSVYYLQDNFYIKCTIYTRWSVYLVYIVYKITSISSVCYIQNDQYI